MDNIFTIGDIVRRKDGDGRTYRIASCNDTAMGMLYILRNDEYDHTGASFGEELELIGNSSDTTFTQTNKTMAQEQQTPKKQLEKAKGELAENLLPFIEEFENKTGFNVSNIVMNRKTVLNNDHHHITRVWLDINVDI